MGDLPLTLACWDYDRTRALQDGSVRPAGIDLTYLPIRMPESFFRMRRFGEFDASEMSFSVYVRTVRQEPRPFVAIPVFPSRMFRHGCIYVHAGSGIEQPGDLVGKRVGCPEYQMTAAVWIKGILAEHHGVPVDSVSYHTGGLLEPGRAEMPLQLPSHIRVEPIPAGSTLSELLDRGEIDALYSADAPEPFERGAPNVRRLFPDFATIERDYFAATGIFPIMHTVVIRTDVYERNRWVARSLLTAFEEAQRRAHEDLRQVVALKTMLPWLPAHVAETERLFGTADFWPYGVERNRTVLETFLRYSAEQGLIEPGLAPEDLFAPETLEASRT